MVAPSQKFTRSGVGKVVVAADMAASTFFWPTEKKQQKNGIGHWKYTKLSTHASLVAIPVPLPCPLHFKYPWIWGCTMIWASYHLPIATSSNHCLYTTRVRPYLLDLFVLRVSSAKYIRGWLVDNKMKISTIMSLSSYNSDRSQRWVCVLYIPSFIVQYSLGMKLCVLKPLVHSRMTSMIYTFLCKQLGIPGSKLWQGRHS